MPSPTANQIGQAVINALPASFKSGPTRAAYPSNFDSATGLHKSQLAFINQLASDLAGAWTSWMGQLLFGGVSVTGLGIGTWAGTGGGGRFQTNSLNFTIGLPSGFSATPANTTMRQAIQAATINKFRDFITKYTTQAAILDFVGTSTATIITPGAFLAVNDPIALLPAQATSVVLETAAQVQSDIMGRLSGFGQAQTIDPAFYSAYSQALIQVFTYFMTNSEILDNTATGPSVPPVGAGVGVSLTNGVVQ